MLLLSKIIVSSYGLLLEVSLWIILVGSFLGGWMNNGFIGALVALVGALVFCIVFFGAFLTILDIRQSVRAIEAKLKSSN